MPFEEILLSPTGGWVLFTIFLASLVRSSLGFGDALVAMPLLTLAISIQQASPLVAMLSTTSAAMILLQDWKSLDLRGAARLAMGAVIGVPIGAWVLTTVDVRIVKSALAIFILLFSSYSLRRPKMIELKSDRWAPLFGFAGGVLGGAYGTSGPPIVIYGAVRRWTAETFRTTIQGFFLPTCIVLLAVHAYHDLWTTSVLAYYGAGLPLILIATALGRILNQRLDGPRFATVVHWALVVVAVMLLATVFFAAEREKVREGAPVHHPIDNGRRAVTGFA